MFDVEVDASVWAVSSEASVACAEASATWALMTAVWSDVGSSDATTCPADTCWPTFTSTVPTVPAVANVRSACWTGVTVPTLETVATAEPIATGAVR